MRFKMALSATLLLSGVAFGPYGAAPALAGPKDLTVIGQQCAAQNRPAAVCNCMVQKAASQLNSNQQAFMAAQMAGNNQEIARIQSMITPQEASATATFMNAVVGQCGG